MAYPNKAMRLDAEVKEEILTQVQTNAPTETERGGVLQQPAIADLIAAPDENDFNGLLAALRAAGILAEE